MSQGTPWTARQSITGLTHEDRQSFAFTFIPMGNLEASINPTPLSACTWTVEGSWSTRREATHTGKTCKLHTENSRTF